MPAWHQFNPAWQVRGAAKYLLCFSSLRWPSQERYRNVHSVFWTSVSLCWLFTHAAVIHNLFTCRLLGLQDLVVQISNRVYLAASQTTTWSTETEQDMETQSVHVVFRLSLLSKVLFVSDILCVCVCVRVCYLSMSCMLVKCALIELVLHSMGTEMAMKK